MNLESIVKNSSLYDLENEISKKCDTIELEVEHEFFNGIYFRKLHIPKGVMLIGKRHREKTVNMLIKGSMTIYDEHNSFDIEAGWYAESEKFTKKAGFAHEDSIFINIHITSETDINKLEKLFTIEEDEYNLLIGKELKCLG